MTEADNEFVALVRGMRTAQRQHENTKHETALRERRDLERRVDRALAEYAARRRPFQSELAF